MNELPKRVINLLVAPFIMSFILLALAGAWRLYQSPSAMYTIGVAGEGKAVAKPDIAEVSFSVVSQGSDPSRVQSDNDKKMARVIEFLKSQAIGDDDVKTTGYNLSPQYEYDRDGVKPPRVVGYTLTQSVSAKIRDINAVGKVVGGLVESGANQINGIVFSVDNPEPLKAEARTEAIAKARAQASAIASSLGVRLGKVLNFSESPIFLPAALPFGGKGGGEFSVSPIQPGTLEFTVSVHITYSIR